MPSPPTPRDGDVRRGADIRAFLWRVAPYLPLHQRGLPSLAALRAFQPARLDWRRLRGSPFVEPSGDVLQNTRRRITFRLKNGRIEARWKPERSDFYQAYAERRLAQWRRQWRRQWGKQFDRARGDANFATIAPRHSSGAGPGP